MAGAASIWGRPLLYLLVFLSAELRSYGLAAATPKPGKTMSPSEWPLGTISRGPTVAGAISFIMMEEACSGGRTLKNCLEKLPLAHVAKIVEETTVNQSDSSLAAILESYANPLVWQRLLAVQKALRHRKARQAQTKTARQELSTCKEDLETAAHQIANTTVTIASREEATKRELTNCWKNVTLAEDESQKVRLQRENDDAECRLNIANKTATITLLKGAIKQEIEMTTVTIASREEATKRELTNCWKNVTLAEDESQKVRLQRENDDAECRLNIANKTATITLLKGAIKQEIEMTTVTIASREEATKRELTNCWENVTLAEDESQKVRLQRENDDAECRLNIANKTATITLLKGAIKQEIQMCKRNVTIAEDEAKKASLQYTPDNDDCRRKLTRQRKARKQKVSRAMTVCKEEVWRLKDDWITDLADYEEEVDWLKTLLKILFVLSIGLAIVVVGLFLTLCGRENRHASRPESQQPRRQARYDIGTGRAVSWPCVQPWKRTSRLEDKSPSKNERCTEPAGFRRPPAKTLQHAASTGRLFRGMITPMQGLMRSNPASLPTPSLQQASPSLQPASSSPQPVSSPQSIEPATPVPAVVPFTTNGRQETDADRVDLINRLREKGLTFLVWAADFTDMMLFGSAFSVGNRVGAGGFGEIHVLEVKHRHDQQRLNDHLGHNRGLVLKKLVGDNPPAAARNAMSREIEIVRSFPPGGHPNVVRHVASNLTVGAIAMEAMSFDYTDLISGGEPRFSASSQQRHRIVVGAGHGLNYLHVNGFTHGDFKPSNILLSEDLTKVKLADWGLSGRSDEDVLISAASAYAAPEVSKACFFAETPLLLGPSQDVYSFGLFYWQAVNKMHCAPTFYGELLRHFVRGPLVNRAAFTRIRQNLIWCQEENDRDPWSAGVRDARGTERWFWETFEGARVKMSTPLSEDMLSVDRCPGQENLQHPHEVKKFVSAMLHPDPNLRLGMEVVMEVLAHPQLSATTDEPPVGLPGSLQNLLDTLVVADVGTTDNEDAWWTKAPMYPIATRAYR